MKREEKVLRLRNLKMIKEFSLGAAWFLLFIVLLNMVDGTQKNFWVGSLTALALAWYIDFRTDFFVKLGKRIKEIFFDLKKEYLDEKPQA